MENTMSKNKRGISLIVLVITIIVAIILAGIVVIGLTDKNPVDKANESRFKNDISEFRAELSLSLVSEKADNRRFDPSTVNLEKEAMNSYIESLGAAYYNKLAIVAGELVYIGDNDYEKQWAGDLGMSGGAVIQGYEETPGENPTQTQTLTQTPEETPEGVQIYEDTHIKIGDEEIEAVGSILRMKIPQYGMNLEAGTGIRGTDEEYYFILNYDYLSDDASLEYKENFIKYRCIKLNTSALVVVGTTPNIKTGDVKKEGNNYYACMQRSSEEGWEYKSNNWVKLTS